MADLVVWGMAERKTHLFPHPDWLDRWDERVARVRAQLPISTKPRKDGAMTASQPPSVEQLADRLAALSARVAELEDELAVRRLIASYGPSVDSGDSAAAGALWTENAVYDMDVGVLHGSAGISEMVLGDTHQEIIDGGSSHNIGPALVEIDGDRAVAITYSQIFRGDGNGGFYVWRIAANRWELIRNADGWRIANRFTRLLDGRDEAREILRRSVR